MSTLEQQKVVSAFRTPSKRMACARAGASNQRKRRRSFGEVFRTCKKAATLANICNDVRWFTEPLQSPSGMRRLFNQNANKSLLQGSGHDRRL